MDNVSISRSDLGRNGEDVLVAERRGPRGRGGEVVVAGRGAGGAANCGCGCGGQQSRCTNYNGNKCLNKCGVLCPNVPPYDVCSLPHFVSQVVSPDWVLYPDPNFTLGRTVCNNLAVQLLYWTHPSATHCRPLPTIAMVRVILNNPTDQDFVSVLTPRVLLRFLTRQHALQGDVFFQNPVCVALPVATPDKRVFIPANYPNRCEAGCLKSECPGIYVPPGSGSKLASVYLGDEVQRIGSNAILHIFYAPWNHFEATASEEQLSLLPPGQQQQIVTNVTWLGTTIAREQMVHVNAGQVVVAPVVVNTERRVDNRSACDTSASVSCSSTSGYDPCAKC